MRRASVTWPLNSFSGHTTFAPSGNTFVVHVAFGASGNSAGTGAVGDSTIGASAGGVTWRRAAVGAVVGGGSAFRGTFGTSGPDRRKQDTSGSATTNASTIHFGSRIIATFSAGRVTRRSLVASTRALP
jgi:hypothetical protein